MVDRDLADLYGVETNADTPNEKQKLIQLLTEVAKIENLPEDEVLYQTTKFTGKDGNIVEGKRSIDELSERQRDVVINKLEKRKGG